MTYNRRIGLIIVVVFAVVSLWTAGSIPARAQDDMTYSLDWRIAAGETVAYLTTLQSTNPTVTFNFDEVFDANAMPDDLAAQIDDLSVILPDTGSLISLLRPNARGNVAVTMIVQEMGTPDTSAGDPLNEEFNTLMAGMVDTVQLRGELTPDGAIASFYMVQRQRNLLALFFELPTTPVAVGDTWSLDVHCLEMGHGFIVDTAERVNRVQLVAIATTPDGQTIAVLDYLIAEDIAGEFQTPLSDEASPIAMTCSFVGRGEFLIDAGRWHNLAGELSIRSAGFMESDVTQLLGLVPLALADVPPAYFDLR